MKVSTRKFKFGGRGRRTKYEVGCCEAAAGDGGIRQKPKDSVARAIFRLSCPAPPPPGVPVLAQLQRVESESY